MRYLLIVICAFYFPSPAKGQEPWKRQLDSLKVELVRKGDTNTSPELLLAIGERYKSVNPDSAAKYYEAGGMLAEKVNNLKGRFRYLALMTELNANQAKSEEALLYCRKMLDLSNQFKEQHYLAGTYNNMGAIYSDLGKPEKALEYYNKAIALYELEKEKNNKNLAYAYGNLLGIYVSLEQKEKAYIYGQKALAYSKAINDDVAIAVTSANLSSVMVKLGKPDSALFLARQEYAIGVRVNDKALQINALGNMNGIYANLYQFDSLLHIAEEMFVSSTEMRNMEGLANADYYMALYYFSKSNFRKAKEYLQSALIIVDSNNIRDLTERNVHLLFSHTYLALGDIAMFHHHYRIFDSLHEVYFSDKILKYNQQLEGEYELNKKQSEINKLNSDKEIQSLRLAKQQNTNIILVSLISGIALISLLYYRNHTQKTRLLQAGYQLKQQQVAELEKEKQLLSAQSILQGQEEERKRMATDLHDGLGSMLSATRYAFNTAKEKLYCSNDCIAGFEKSMEMLDRSIIELRRVAHNMMPEALMKFGLDTALKDFCYNINQNGRTHFIYQSFNVYDERVPKDIAIPVYRIIQELTNNILKHAEASTGLIQLIIDNNVLSITVEDNGKGFNITELKGTKGIGYSILQSRIAYLNGVIDIHSDPQAGTSVTIEFPNVFP